MTKHAILRASRKKSVNEQEIIHKHLYGKLFKKGTEKLKYALIAFLKKKLLEKFINNIN